MVSSAVPLRFFTHSMCSAKSPAQESAFCLMAGECMASILCGEIRSQRIDASQQNGALNGALTTGAPNANATAVRRTHGAPFLSPSADKKLHLFQMDRQIDKISRRDANRVTNVCLVSLTTRYFLGYPYMKLNVALAASIATFALMGCSKQEAAETAAPAADAAASSADAAASSADAAASSAAAATDAAATAAAPADGAMAPAAPAADAAAAPAAPAEAPKN